ncbi:MAG: PepSY domain-containing protein [Steroidobacteraceae bacterium]
MPRTSLRLPCLLIALGVLCAPCLSGRSAEPEGKARADAELSREQAVTLVQQRYAARVVRVEVAEQGGRRVYVFRLLSGGGKVWTVRIDAHSGAEAPLP